MQIFSDEKGQVYYAVRKDVDVFLDFCFQFFEVWIWSCYTLTKAQQIASICFHEHYQKFKVFLSNKSCQNANIMMGYRRVYHKNLTFVWDIFKDLHGDNTLIFDDTPYRVMWNMHGTYLIFPKMWNQTPVQLESFLEVTIIPWLLGWLCAKNKRIYTSNTIVNMSSDPKTNHVIKVYLSRRN